MDFWQKVEHFEKDMEARSGRWGSWNSIPPYCRIAWKLGIKARPPLFLGFWRITIGLGVWMAVAWGLFMWFLSWREKGWSPLEAALTAGVAGAAFGAVMAWLIRRRARTLGLPSWDEYPGTGSSEAAQAS